MGSYDISRGWACMDPLNFRTKIPENAGEKTEREREKRTFWQPSNMKTWPPIVFVVDSSPMVSRRHANSRCLKLIQVSNRLKEVTSKLHTIVGFFMLDEWEVRLYTITPSIRYNRPTEIMSTTGNPCVQVSFLSMRPLHRIVVDSFQVDNSAVIV